MRESTEKRKNRHQEMRREVSAPLPLSPDQVDSEVADDAHTKDMKWFYQVRTQNYQYRRVTSFSTFDSSIGVCA